MSLTSTLFGRAVERRSDHSVSIRPTVSLPKDSLIYSASLSKVDYWTNALTEYMAKAIITTPDGVKIDVEGSPREIIRVVKDIRGQAAAEQPSAATQRRTPKRKPGRVLLVDLLGSLRDGGFFKKPRDLASVKSALAEMGHHYPVTTLSPVMLRQVRRRNLRRLREKGRWMYAQ